MLIYTFVEHTVEEWACLLLNHGKNGIARSLCRELQAARYLLIPLFVLGMAFLALVVWLRFKGSEKQSLIARSAIADEDVKTQV